MIIVFININRTPRVFCKMKYFSTALLITTLTLLINYSANAENSNKTKVEKNAPETFGKWQLSCPDNHKCRIAQTIIQKKTEKTIVIARVFKDKGSVLLISLPKGIFLAPGVSVRIDNKGKFYRYPFETCDDTGCHSGLKLSKRLLSALKRGNFASVIFYDSRQKPVLAKLSLEGFTKAYKALK